MPAQQRMPWERDPRLVATLPQAPRIPWGRFLKTFQWSPGEHAAIVGPAGSGKTILLQELVGTRSFSTVFATKPKDSSMDEIIDRQGFERYAEWPRGLDPLKHPRRVIWPDARRIDAAREQSVVFANAFAEIYIEGGWNLFLDEGWY